MSVLSWGSLTFTRIIYTGGRSACVFCPEHVRKPDKAKYIQSVIYNSQAWRNSTSLLPSPFSIVHTFQETGSVSVLRWEGGRHLLCSFR
jgi:hypothetical protein